jgi:ABC-type branched-subunit amino acid transport system substrate-binding protein
VTRILPVALLLALLAGCAEPARVGAIVSRSGAASSYGEQVARGFDLAIEQINAAGGVGGRKLELLYRDDSTNPEVGLAALRELVENDRVTTVLGAVSSTVTLRLAPYCQRRKVVLISPSASAPQLTEAGDYIFRTFPSDVLEGTSMADFARDLGLDRVAVLAVDNTYGQGLARAFSTRLGASGVVVVASLTFPEGDATAIAREVATLPGLSPRGLYIPAYVGDLATALAALREINLRPIVLGTSSATRELLRVAGPAAENLVFPLPSFDPTSDSAGVRAFSDAFRARFATEPDVYAAHAYDAVRVLAAAAEKSGSWSPDDIRNGLLRIDDYDGATGVWRSTGTGTSFSIPAFSSFAVGSSSRTIVSSRAGERFPFLGGSVVSMSSSFHRPFLSIVVPAYNEEGRLGASLAKIASYVDASGVDAEVLVVDDGSKDRTAEIAAKAFGALRGRVVKNGENRGKGYSVRNGVLEARGRFVLLTDADLSTPIEDHAKLAAVIRDRDLDVVIGSRALPDSDVQVRQAWHRQTMGRMFNGIIRALTGLPFRDTQCGFKLFDRDRVKPLFEKMVVDRFAFDVELLFLCERFGLSVADVPVIWRNAAGSKVSILRDPLNMIFDVLRVRWRFRRGLYNPDTGGAAAP